MSQKVKQAADIITQASHVIAFTGAGISVESGIPPFRGEGGLWNKYDPQILDLDYYTKHPEIIVQIEKMFHEVIYRSKPNAAHYALAELEKMGLLKAIITQNIDNLHFDAGNKNVIEFHGNTRNYVCMSCSTVYKRSEIEITSKGAFCPKCGGLLKPDFVFFGEAIPSDAYMKSIEHASKADVVLVIGTTGLIQPASIIPHLAKDHGATIIEVNVEPTVYTNEITDIFLQGKATEVMTELLNEIKNKS